MATCPVCHGTDHIAVGSKDGYDFHRCGECTVLFVHPMPSPEVLTEFYNDYHKSGQYNKKIQSKTKRARKRIASLRRRGQLSFLDVGCNLGFATEAGRSLGYRALGIDVDTDAIERAKAMYPQADFRCADIAELANEGQKFDVLYCSEVIEHLLEPDRFLGNVKAVMKPDAVLYLTTPDVGHFTLPRATRELIKWGTFRPPEHLIYFNKRSLAGLFSRLQFGRTRFQFNFKPTLKVVAWS